MPDASVSPARPRILAVDALRGLTIMFMILVNNPGTWGAIYPPLKHADWHGCTPTDLVFPSFLFVVGVSIVLGLSRRRNLRAAGQAGAGLHGHILRRSLLLVAIGVGLGVFPLFRDFVSFEIRPPSTWRLPGVLQRIGVCYGIAALLYLHLRPRSLILVCLLCLFGYWAVLVWVPVEVPGMGVAAGVIDAAHKDGNVGAWLDRLVFGPAHLWMGRGWDPEGLLSTVPALVTCLLGVFAGMQLQSPASRAGQAWRLLLAGLVLVVCGLVWDRVLPLNKPLWTSSYAVFSGGVAMAALGLLLYLADVRAWRRPMQPLQVYGVNALAVFVGSALLARLLTAIRPEVEPGRFVPLRRLIFESGFDAWITPRELASLAFALTWVAGWYLVLRQMYRRGWIIKL